MSSESDSEGTSTGKVVLAAILCWLLSVWFWNLLKAYGAPPLSMPFAYLAGVLISWRVARERVLTAAIPTACFLLLGVVVDLTVGRDESDRVEMAVILVFTMLACLGFAWWLARRASTHQGQRTT